MKGQKDIPEGQPNCLFGKAFMLTGILESLEREEATGMISPFFFFFFFFFFFLFTNSLCYPVPSWFFSL
jgi:hypothetical protein